MPEELFRDRGRAESFGSIAGLYDRYRPAPAPEFVDDLVALKPAQVLDIGCGTGKVARELTRRGLDVLGVELDERMAGIAREHGLEVDVSAFETWDDRGRTFDLITCGDAWHWIDPVRGWRKIGRVLRPGGTVVRFWNHNEVDEPLRSALLAVHDRVLPEIEHRTPERTRGGDDPRVEHRIYPWVRDLQRRRVGRADRHLQRQPDARAQPVGRAPARAARGDHRPRRHRRRARLDRRQLVAGRAALTGLSIDASPATSSAPRTTAKTSSATRGSTSCVSSPRPTTGTASPM